MTDGLQGKLKERPNEETKFNIADKGRYGWVPHGDIMHWCHQQHLKNPQDTEGWTEEMFWNMILFTQNVITEKCCYNI
eukprot:5686418-Heterocapsa_arctica.AAC.1